MLFTLEPDRVAALLTAWPGVFPELPLTVIGRMVEAGAGDMLTGGWDHFRE
jgi:hypothetical protein